MSEHTTQKTAPKLEHLIVKIRNWLGSAILGELPDDEVFDNFESLSNQDKRTLFGFILGIARGTQAIWAQEIENQSIRSRESHQPYN
jgi:hypothetical protein